MPRFLVVTALIVVSAALIGLGGAEGGFTTVYVVRHAEAEQTGDDPGLTDAGRRSFALADLLRSIDLDAVYATAYTRTRETAAPTAELHDTPIVEYGAKDADGLVRELLAEHAGGTVLVVGHSNTVPMIVGALGAGEIDEIPHDEHDNLYVVTIAPNGDVGLQRLRLPDAE